MPNLENLKKQAKQYLRWHRDRYYPVAAIIREHVPRFSELSDPEILAAAFRLADAQELVARKEGFEGWTALRTGACTAMSQTHPHSQPILTSVAAHLYVRDIKASTGFFTTKLGFTIDFVYGDPPFYGQVSRDNARLALHVGWMRLSLPKDIPGTGGLAFSLNHEVGSAEEDPSNSSLPIRPPRVTFSPGTEEGALGAKTFAVRDPDGNLVILFAGPAN